MSYNLEILKALSDETRLKIVLTLLKEEKSVLELVAIVSKSQPNVSLALKKLEYAGLVAARKEQKKVFYRINNRELVEQLLALIKT